MFRQRKSFASMLQSLFGSRRTRKLRSPQLAKKTLRLEHLEARDVPATFTVNSVLDDGSTGTLRWAIDQANASAGFDTINFNFVSTGVHTIQPTSPLPWITGATKIDGYSHAGSSPNTQAIGSDAVLTVEIDGSVSGGSGFVLAADGCTVQGLVINNFPGYGVVAYQSDNNVIAGNFIGTDPSGTLARPNDWGIKVISGANNMIGGAAAAARNVVSGNKYDGINLQGTYNPSDWQTVGNQVVNNYAGTNAAGDAALPNGSPTSDGGGISVGGGSGNFVIGNLISGNDDGGLSLGDWNSTVQGNKIGTDATGTLPIPNTGNLYYPQYGNGIGVYGNNNTIGGTAPGQGNLIAFNAGAGIYVTIHGVSYGTTSASIRGNSIHSNGGLGIDLAPELVNSRGPNANDDDDVDVGPNAYQNFPLIASASSSGSGTVVTGTLNSTPSTAFTLDFYASPTPDSSGYGEGQLYLGSASVTTNSSGDVAFTRVISGSAPVGWALSATATTAGGTSEFSTTTTVHLTGGVINTNDSGPGSLRQAIIDTNAKPGDDLIWFDMNPADPNHVYYADDGIAGQVSAANITVTSAANDSDIANLDPDHPHSWWSIKPTSMLPRITGVTTIDGYTQPGSSANTRLGALNTVLRIELNGSQAGATGSTGGLFFDQLNSTLRGLSVNSFYGGQVNVGSGSTATGFALEGNFIGVDPSGLRAGTVQGRGILVFVDSDGRIGTNADGVDDPAERNLISGGTYGIDFNGGSGYVVAGNLIGTDITGTRAIPNSVAGIIVEHNSITIGGTTEVARNVISGNAGTGIVMLLTESPGNIIHGNYIGVDATGTAALGNSLGISVSSNRVSDVLIGGTASGARNIISGNRGAGIQIGARQAYTTVQGNFIGTDATGTLDIGNKIAGIILTNSPDNLIGGFEPGAGNLIAFNGPGTLTTDGDGIRITGTSTNNRIEGNTITGNSVSGVRVSDGSGNIIRGNSIHSNGGLGIDLQLGTGKGGVTFNDAGDVDAGPNGYQNFPLLAAASSGGSGTVVTGTLNSTPSTSFTLDFYASPTADPTGHGEGKLYLGSFPVTTNGGGDAAFFDEALAGTAPVGWVVSATATGPEGTSEFSSKTTVVSSNDSPNDLAITGESIFENDVFTLTGSFTDADANDEHTVTVNWGEGDPEVFVLPVGTRSFSFTHQYRDDNPTATGSDDYAVSVSVSDGTESVDADQVVTVVNVAPSNLTWSLSDHDINENDSVTVSGTFSDPGTLDRHTVTVNWGNGDSTTYTLPVGDRSYSVSYTYADDNPTATWSDRYGIAVSIADDDHGTASSAEYAPTVLADAPVLYWRLSENSGTTATNLGSLGGAADGEYFGPVLGVAGATTDGDPAIGLGAPTDSRVVATSMSFPTTAVSLEFWLKTSATNNGHPFSYAAGTHDNEFLVSENCGTLWINDQAISTSINVEDGLWHHMVFTWQSSDGAVRIYKDGVLAFSGTHQAGAVLTAGGVLMLGQDQDAVGGALEVTQRFIGSMDEVALYDRVLSAEQVRTHHSTGVHLNVRNVAPSSLAWSLNDEDVNESGSVVVSGTFADPGTQDRHTVTINWGDGSTQSYPLLIGDRSFQISHTYTDDNPTGTPYDHYVVRVSVADDDLGSTGLIFGLKSENAGATARTRPPVHLYTFRPDGTAFTNHGLVRMNGSPIDADALAYSPALGLFAYQMIHVTSGVAPTSSQFVSLDPTTAEATPIGSALDGRGVRGAAFDLADRLWVIDQLQDQLLQIDPDTGAIIGTPVNLTLDGSPFDLGDLTDLAIRDDGAFIVSDGAGVRFYTLDSATGELTFLTQDTVSQPGQSTTAPTGIGLAFSGDSLLAYDAQGTEDIYRYDTANNYARTTVFLNIIPNFNAGQGDLAAAAAGVKVTVRNLDPVIETITATSAFGTGLVHLTGTYSDVGADTHTLTIDWGHGSPETVTITDGVFHVTHQYPASSIEPANLYTISVTLTDDDTGTDSATATFATSTISGTAYLDADGDGVQDPGEPGLADWIVYVDADNDGIRDEGEPWTTTVGSGEYTLGELPAGSHHIRLEGQSGWTTTGSYIVGVGSGDAIDGGGLGVYRNSVISGGRMFEDENGNGIHDEGEPGLGGRIVFLDGDDDGVLDPGESYVITDPDGSYSFGDLPLGDYRIRTEVPSGWELITDPVNVSVTASGQTLPGGAIGTRLLPTSLSGFVWLDADNDGLIDAGEQGVGGVRIELSGVNDRGETVSRSTTTDADGHYMFDGMRPGTYQIHEVQPGGLIDGIDAVGSLGGTLANDLISAINVDAGRNGIQYNFGERAPTGSYLHRGQTATIGFWQNKNGQALIKSLNGGPNATALGNWLASNFPNMYGTGTGANNLTGRTNAQVAAYYLTLFKVKGQKLEAQVLATAFAVYSTSSGLAGTVATAYGFEVSSAGTGSATFNVGSNGAAFGVANNTTMTVMDILRATNARASGGVLYAGQTSHRNMANTVFDAINNEGDIE